MNKIISKLRNDFSALFFSKTRKYRLLLFSFCSTNITKLMLSLKKVQYGSNCKFYGLPYINRAYNSKISIGQKCTFRSDRTSNLIGINRNCIISSFKENTIISIGNSCGFSGTVIGASESIVIGNDVLCGANTLITDFDWHPIDPIKRHTSEGVKSAPVIIEDNVFLGANSVVLKGVRIGKNSVIGANSVVVKDIPENVIAAGNPCKVLKQL